MKTLSMRIGTLRIFRLFSKNKNLRSTFNESNYYNQLLHDTNANCIDRSNDLEFNIKKKFKHNKHNSSFSFCATIKKGDFITVTGESGAGKTTLLRLLSGLTIPDSGFIRFGNNIWYDHSNRINVLSHKRNAGMVFQDYALFPNMTVYKNLLYAAGKKQTALINDLLDLTGLLSLADRYPINLSGGQRQRVAIIRSFVKCPDLLLLDEPLNALDEHTHGLILEEILRLHKLFKTTIIMVSHNIEEVLLMSDKVFTLLNGSIDSISTPKQILSSKAASEYTIQGFISSIISDQEKSVLSICINDTILQVTVSYTEGKKYKIGKRVLVSIRLDNPKISSIQKEEKICF